MDPNFPKNLNIKPLKTTHNLSDNLFGPEAQQSAIQSYGIAGRVWEAAYAMTTYLDPSSSWSFDPPPFTRQKSGPLSILELGSGTGIVASLIATFIDANDLLIATDLPEVCPLLEQNLTAGHHESSAHNLVVQPLSWGTEVHAQNVKHLLADRQLSYIICSDLVYFPELLGPLLRSLLHLTSKNFLSKDGSTPTIVISYMIRSLTKESPFWSAFGLWFQFYPVLANTNLEGATWQPLGSAVNDDPCFVFQADRRPESLDWVVPASDEELLGGVGANGSSSRKEDSTFESLLLFAMED